MTSRGRLCDACYSLFFEQPPGGSDVHHLSGSELKACAETRSCSLCANLWAGCSDIQQADLCRDRSSIETADSNEASHLRCSYRDKQLSFTLPIDSIPPGSQRVELRFEPSPLGYESIIDASRKRFSDKTFSKRTAKLAKQWISMCKTLHAHSKLMPPNKLMPSRLIEVGTLDQPVIRVCETGAMLRDVKFVTLSHRWINGKTQELLKDNLQAYREAIPPDLLSNNFKDAIAITRMIDVGYIWIDSLCILQDSTADWAKESAHMADYYQCSYCTLSATSSTEFDRGMIIDRDTNVVIPTFYDFRSLSRPDQEKKSVFKRLADVSTTFVKATAGPDGHLLPLAKYVLHNEGSWRREIDGSPLQKRGWCYQERLLSPRILHFCKTRVFFECLESKCSEEAPHGISQDAFIQQMKETSPEARLLQMKKADPSECIKLFHTVWATTVSYYSQRDFTFATDRLVALAGVAERLRELASLQDGDDQTSGQIKCHRNGQKLPDYFMGLWLCNQYAVNNLCWCTDGSFMSRPKELRGVVPTWSFGSVTSAVTFAATQISENDIDMTARLANIVEVEVDFQTEHGFDDEQNLAMWTGRIHPSTGALWLEGPLLPVQLSSKVIDEAQLQEDQQQYYAKAGTWPNVPLLMIGDEIQRWAWQPDALRSGSAEDNHGWCGQYFVAGLCTMPIEKQLYGIVLEWAAQGDGCYERVGSVSWGPSEVDDGLHHFQTHLNNCEDLDSKFYEARVDKTQVRFKII